MFFLSFLRTITEHDYSANQFHNLWLDLGHEMHLSNTLNHQLLLKRRKIVDEKKATKIKAKTKLGNQGQR